MKAEFIQSHTGYKDRDCDLCGKRIQRQCHDSGDITEQYHHMYKIKEDDVVFCVCEGCGKKYDDFHAKERAKQKRIATKKRNEAKKKLIEYLKIKVKKKGKKNGR